ncbi:hypothetical protein [Bacteroides sp. f07]|uniref:hypothetical protein n=1 Tax=Bacteroides sp. f07 TaxID=3132704 RepID=UPI0036F38D69
MAKRIMKAQLKPCTCKLCTGIDYEITKPNLALTPQNIKDLTDRGIAVNLPNEKTFLQGDSISNAKSWDVEPVFKRSSDMCELWELEQVSKNKVLKAHKVDKRKFG